VAIQEDVGAGNTDQESPFLSYMSSRLTEIAMVRYVNLRHPEVGRGQVLLENQVFVLGYIP